MKMNILILIQLSLIALLSCEKEDNKNDFPLSLSYELLDSLGNSKTTFSKGEEIIFSFKITNNSDSILYFETNFINEEFFKVYKIENGEKISMGRSFKGLYCYYVPTPAFHILPGKSGGVAIPWSPVNEHYYPFCNLVQKPPLDVGDYFTGFESNFIFYTKNKEIVYNTDIMTFTINFKIE